MNEYEAVTKILQFPIQIAMVGLFYWLFSKGQDRNQKTWEDRLSDLRTNNEKLINVIEKSITTLSEIAACMKNLTAEVMRHEQREEQCLGEIKEKISHLEK